MAKAISYVALLRGIAPTDPNMRNDKLRGLFTDLGFGNVRTVISSGNVLFESDSRHVDSLEATIEKALPEKLGFASTTIIRSKAQIEELVGRDPFRGVDDPSSYLLVTFLKRRRPVDLTFPYRPEGAAFELISEHDRAICSVTDLTRTKAPDVMTWLERRFGKEITSRTWKTVGRILGKL